MLFRRLLTVAPGLPAGVGGQFYIDEDRWRIKTGLIYADVNYRLFGIGQDSGGNDRYVRINQSVLGFQFDLLRYVGGDIHIGPVI